MNKVTGQLKAWLPEHSNLSPEQIGTPAALESLVFSGYDMKNSGWTYVGEATITVDLILTPEQLIASKIETLKVQQTKVRSEAQERVNHLEGMIQNLLAITYVADAS
jgi:hypothetical protein